MRRISKNRPLPPRCRWIRNAIYYDVPRGQESAWDGKKLFRMGINESEMYKVLAEKTEIRKNVRTIQQLLERYLYEVVPDKAKASQKKNRKEVTRLIEVFGEAPLLGLLPQHVYQYFDGRKSKATAKREVALLSHAFTKAVEWGYIHKHPFKGEVRVKNAKPRNRYVEDWEIIECLALPKMREKGSVTAIQSYIRLKLLTGLRKGDLLRLRVCDFKEDGLYVSTSKTNKAVVYERSVELERAIFDARSSRPVDISPYLFCNKRGESYVNEDGEAPGWKSMWRRFFKRVIAETKVTEHFTDHDLRAKVASDADSLERARELLAHADSKITNRVYRRKAERIKPVK